MFVCKSKSFQETRLAKLLSIIAHYMFLWPMIFCSSYPCVLLAVFSTDWLTLASLLGVSHIYTLKFTLVKVYGLKPNCDGLNETCKFHMFGNLILRFTHPCYFKVRLSEGNWDGERPWRTGAVMGCAVLEEQSGEVRESHCFHVLSSGLWGHSKETIRRE